jgi:hypothetical protein
MPGKHDKSDAYSDFIALLHEFERLSKRVDGFVKAHDDPQSADVLFAVASVKDAADRAAIVLRVHVRRPN